LSAGRGTRRKRSLARLYEHRGEPLLPRRRFLRRLAAHAAVALAFVVGSLAIGIAGYTSFEDMGLLDAFLNAAMLLGGMGPVEQPTTPGGKLFAGLYALYAGLVFLIVAGIVFTPVLHRLMHRFHLGGDE
jgi:hypothetical protein